MYAEGTGAEVESTGQGCEEIIQSSLGHSCFPLKEEKGATGGY